MSIPGHVPAGKPVVGVLPDQKVVAWPKYEQGPRVIYGPLSAALTEEHDCDAHTFAYHCPIKPRRLDAGALEPDAIADLGGSIEMVIACFDVDCAESHRAGGSTDPCPAPDVWWLDELTKLRQLLVAHPGGYFYRTRGGYRILYVLPRPFLLSQSADALEWSRTYCSWLAYLERVFAIHADPCKDWQRLFRLPHATRDGETSPERRDIVGDAENIGTWDPVLLAVDVSEGKRMTKKKAPRIRAEEESADPRCDGSGVLFRALEKRGAIRRELGPGKWAIDCPKMEEHSSQGQTDTVLWAPHVGDIFGYIYCSHTGCGHDRFALHDWLTCFSTDEISAAYDAAKVVTDPPRPTIFTNAELHKTVAKASRALSQNLGVFSRGTELVRVVGRDISPHTIHSLRVELSRSARWVGETPSGISKSLAAPPDSVVCGIADAGTWENMRELEGVIDAPTLRPDGSLLDSLGYDVFTKLLRVEGEEIGSIPEAPTQDDAKKAFGELRYIFHDYPFVNESARAVPIASILTIAGRSAIVGATPCFVFDAPTRGSGKTMLADIAAIVATGEEDAPKTTYTSREDELEKMLDDHARKGSRLLLLDNVATPFGGEALDLRLTAIGRVGFRVLGTPETLKVPWRTVVLASGNNIQILDDTIRRCLVGRIESDLERPEDRKDFLEKDLVNFVRQERTRLYRAALVILRAWFVAGRPGADAFTWGSFNPWAQVVAGAVWFASGVNVLDARAVSVGHEVEGSDALLDFMKLLNKTGPMSVKKMLGQPVLCNALREWVPSKPGETLSAKRVGKHLSRSKGRNVGGLKLVCKTSSDENVMVWSVISVVGS